MADDIRLYFRVHLDYHILNALYFPGTVYFYIGPSDANRMRRLLTSLEDDVVGPTDETTKVKGTTRLFAVKSLEYNLIIKVICWRHSKWLWTFKEVCKKPLVDGHTYFSETTVSNSSRRLCGIAGIHISAEPIADPFGKVQDQATSWTTCKDSLNTGLHRRAKNYADNTSFYKKSFARNTMIKTRSMKDARGEGEEPSNSAWSKAPAMFQ